jgi:hypothetical protein
MKNLKTKAVRRDQRSNPIPEDVSAVKGLKSEDGSYSVVQNRPMNDAFIRSSFHRNVLQRFHASPDALVIDELGLSHGRCRADIAIVNGRLAGFEIKSDQDSLIRLSAQIKFYNAVFDHVTIIVGRKHAEAILALVPKWWGIVVGHSCAKHGVRFDTLRSPTSNERVEPYAVAQLLWRNEASSVLEKLGEPASILRQRRSALYERLAAILTLSELRQTVTSCLKRRKNWRSRGPRPPGDDSCLPGAM